MSMPTDVDGLIDCFELAAAVDAAPFTAFEPDELSALRAYSRICRRLNDRPFLRDGMRLSFGDQGLRLEHAGDDALRSAAMDFRLLWMSGERSQFSRLRNIVRGRVDQESPTGGAALAVIDQLGKDLSLARKEAAFGSHDPDSGEIRTVICVADAVDDWLNGTSFHEDPGRADRVGAWSPEAYEYILGRSITRVTNVFFAFAILVDTILEAQAPEQD